MRAQADRSSQFFNRNRPRPRRLSGWAGISRNPVRFELNFATVLEDFLGPAHLLSTPISDQWRLSPKTVLKGSVDHLKKS